MRILIFMVFFILLVSFASATQVSLQITFQERGVSHIVQPVWHHNESDGQNNTQQPPMVVGNLVNVEKLLTDYWYFIVVPATLGVALGVKKRHSRMKKVTGKRIDRGEELGDEKDRLGQTKETTGRVAGRKGIFRRTNK